MTIYCCRCLDPVTATHSIEKKYNTITTVRYYCPKHFKRNVIIIGHGTSMTGTVYTIAVL